MKGQSKSKIIRNYVFDHDTSFRKLKKKDITMLFSKESVIHGTKAAYCRTNGWSLASSHTLTLFYPSFFILF